MELTENLNDRLIRRIEPILEECIERLDSGPSFNDELALKTAISKAAIAAFQVATAEFVHEYTQAAAEAGQTVSFDVHFTDGIDEYEVEFPPE